MTEVLIFPYCIEDTNGNLYQTLNPERSPELKAEIPLSLILPDFEEIADENLKAELTDEMLSSHIHDWVITDFDQKLLPAISDAVMPDLVINLRAAILKARKVKGG